jgi:hypothetical protein
MSKNTVKFEDFEAPYIIYHELAGSYGRESHKTLRVRVNLSNNALSYEVQDHRKVVFETALFDRAIERYNELP